MGSGRGGGGRHAGWLGGIPGSIPAGCDARRPFPGASPGLAGLAFRRPSVRPPCCALPARWEPGPGIVIWKKSFSRLLGVRPHVLLP